MRAVQDREQQVQVPELRPLLQCAQEPGAPHHAGVLPRAAVQVPVLLLQQAPPQRAQEAPGAQAPRALPRAQPQPARDHLQVHPRRVIADRGPRHVCFTLVP